MSTQCVDFDKLCMYNITTATTKNSIERDVLKNTR